MKTLTLASGKSVPVLGQGTAGMGTNKSKREQEIKALQTGIDLGMTLIDTAEYYGQGKSEELIAQAIEGKREKLYLVSKVLPWNATREGTIQACEQSLKRLQTDHLDLYLLHWPGSIPLHETLEAFQSLKKQGKILDYGVSNFDIQLMEETYNLPAGSSIVANQVYYSLTRRGIEWDLLPWCQERNVLLMAYSPFDVGNLLKDTTLINIAKKHTATPTQVSLAWVLRQNGVIAIPKASSSDHIIENHGALRLKLSDKDLKEIDQVFNPPRKKIPLEML